MLTFALIGYLLNAVFYDLFAKGQTCTVVICMQLRIEDSLLRLEKLQTQVPQRFSACFSGVSALCTAQFAIHLSMAKSSRRWMLVLCHDPSLSKYDPGVC